MTQSPGSDSPTAEGNEAFVLRARNLRLGYGRRPVLDEVRLDVRPAEFWFFVGPNGEGKSTLLKAILGELRPQEGELSLSPELASRDKIGFVPQRCDLNPALPTTVREFVSLGLVGLRLVEDGADERLSQALDRVGLGGRAQESYWSLSGGQRQRALVARALIRRPSFLILDEPTNGLDLSAEYGLLDTLAELNRTEGLTMLFVTHTLGLASRYASHMALFHEGRVRAGPAPEVLTAENLGSTYHVPVEVEPDRSGNLSVTVAVKP